MRSSQNPDLQFQGRLLPSTKGQRPADDKQQATGGVWAEWLGSPGWGAPQAQVSLSDRWESARSTETWKPDSLAWAGEGEDALMNCREMVGRNRAGARPSSPEILISFTWHPGLRVLILKVRGLDRRAFSSGIQRLQGEVSGLRGVVAQPRPGHPDHGNSVFTSPHSLRTWGWRGGRAGAAVPSGVSPR